MVPRSRSLVVLLAVGVLLARPPAAPCAYSPWSYFDRAAGLAENTVQAIVPDGAGGLWIGTRGGLSRFDGARWRTLTTADGLPDNDVHSLAPDGPDRLWVGAGSAFGRVDRGAWGRLGAPGVPGRVVVAVDRAGGAWLGHAGGLLRFDPAGDRSASAGGHLEPVAELAGRAVRALLADRSGRLWAGTDDGLRALEGGRWRTVRPQEGLPSGPVGALLEGPQGEIWCGGAGIHVFDGSSWRPVAPAEGLPAAPVTGLAVDGEGRLWAGSAAGAGYTDGYAWRWFDARSGLPGGEALALAADPAGNIWVGTAQGLARHDTSWLPAAAAAREEARPRAPLFARADGATLLIADERGFLVQRDRSVERVGARDKLDARVRAFAEDGGGGVWVGTEQGLFGYDGSVREEHQPQLRRESVEREQGILEARTVVDCDRYHGLTGGVVTALAPDGDGGLWVGTATGLSRLADGAWSCPALPADLAAGPVAALAPHRGGGLWAGSPRGLWELADGAWTRHGRADGLPSDAVAALHVDRDGRLWVGTDRGAARRDGAAWTVFTAKNGLVSDRVLEIAEDAAGRLWFGTQEGVSFLDGGLFGTFGARDGLPAPRVTSIAALAGGRVWFGGDDGVVQHRADRSPPTAWVRNPPAGPVGTPFLVLECGAGDLETPPERLRISWRLDGGPWSPWSADLLVRVADLANGRHRFEVRSVDAELNVSAAPAAAEFEVDTGAFDLELVEATFGPFYASLFQFYATDPDYERRPVGVVALRNRYDRPLRVKASAFLPDLMDFPSDAVATVPPGEVVRVPVRVELSERALDVEKTGTRQLRLTLQYTLGGERKESESTLPVTVIDKHGISWEEPERIALYVTHQDEAVERFARELVRGFREEERAAIVYDNLLRAMELFDGLAARGVRYVPDPANAYAGIVPGNPTLDVVRLPRETLRLRSGDCDDLAVLYAAQLENVGIDTAFVDAYDHLFVMFDTGLTARSVGQLARDPGLLHVDARGRVWVPVETTLIGRPFAEAWESAAATLGSRPHAVIETRAAWKRYAPLRPSAPAPDIVAPPLEQVRARFLADLRRQEEALTSPRMRELAQQIAADPADAAALNALGVLLARRGYLGRAAAQFERVIALRPDFAGGYGNLGNVLYEQGSFTEAVRRYEESLARGERPEVHVELALTFCELGRFDRAREHYARAMAIDASLAPAGRGAR
jgi:ligand-binding sensor domain-containing protein/tetratricopeptide (TPR) repeat protein